MCRKLLSLLLVLIFPFSMIEGNAHAWTAEDALSVKNLTGIRVSPDGNKAIYLIASADGERWHSELYLADVRTGKTTHIDFSQESIASASWSADGQWIYFLMKGKAHQAVWRCSSKGTGPSILFEIDEDIYSYQISPNQRYIAYLKSVAFHEEGEKVRFSRPASTLQLWIANLDGDREPKSVSSVDAQIQEDAWAADYGYDWAPDSTAVVYCYAKADRFAKELVTLLAIYDIRKDSSASLTSGRNWVATPRWSPNGRTIAFTSDRRFREKGENPYLYRDIHVIQPDGSGQQAVGTSPDHSPTLVGWTGDSQHLLIRDIQGIRFQLYRLGLDGTLESPFTTSRQISPGATVNDAGTHVGCVEQSLLTAPEAYVIPLNTGISRQISKAQESSGHLIGKVELVYWESGDSTIEGILVMLPTFTAASGTVPSFLRAFTGTLEDKIIVMP